MFECEYIQGEHFIDNRGGLSFFNSFDMTEIVRMYEISPSDTSYNRGWQAHQLEKKWMFCHTGCVSINVVKIDDFKNPSSNLNKREFILNCNNKGLLKIPSGYATAIKAKDLNSKLLVFSNFSLKQSKDDDYRFDIDTWEVK